MIITCKKEIPFRWIAFAILPWATASFYAGAVSVLFFFSLRKFVDNPAGLTFILSLPGFISIIVQPIVSFLSDRIWTRFGRRKPFIVTSQTGVACCLVLMPLMPNFWALLAVFMVYSAFGDLNATMEPFKQEIVPPQERGRATGAMSWCSNLAIMTFYFVALGRFDDVRYMDGFSLHGETAIYWSIALLLVVMLMLVTLGIREVDQKSALRGQRLTIKNFVGGLLDRELWPVYLLVVGSSCLNFYSGLGPLSNLLYTEQWNYTKEEMGINVAVGGGINLFAIAFLTLFADRLNRMRTYQVLICLSLGCQVLYYSYINFVLPDKRPSLVEIIVFGETISILGILTGLVYVPLVYDYVRRNKMGTYNAGAQVVSKLTTIITLNGVGLFVWAYAVHFQPPAGDMTRVVLRGEQNQQADVIGILRTATWTYPENGAPASASEISTAAWQANGTVSSTGRCWELRLRDKESEKLAADKQRLESENSPLLADEKMLQDDGLILRNAGKAAEASATEAKAQDEETRIDAITTQIKAINAQLNTRAENFHDQVVRVLGSRMIADGDQILAATPKSALVLDLSSAQRPDARRLGKIARELRRERGDVIDLRPLKRDDDGYGVAVSAILPAGTDQPAFARNLQATVAQVATRFDPGLLAQNTASLGERVEPAATLDLMVIEKPVDTYVSPINWVVNGILALFQGAPDPERRLAAMAQSLRVPGQLDHIHIEPGAGPKTLEITAVLPATVPVSGASDAVTARLIGLMQGSSASKDLALRVRTLYDRLEPAAAAQRITVARPTLATDYAAMKYDYMSGYLWMFFMGAIGIVITIAFTHIEAKGLVRKRGVEEAEES